MSNTAVATNTNATMTINVLYFASLADEANCSEEAVVVDKSMSLDALYEQLCRKHQFSRPKSELRVAINDYFAKWTDPIHDGDSIVFITPVAGG
ncbi:MoaD/ThiS family protein [Psychrobacter sp. B38]|uniref:MoaD/ThiS family protein n=1 Tax=Psychrobacter sp. B38 TaxID=3143538 RepID=UPI00320CB077